jgi:hypothetical protein
LLYPVMPASEPGRRPPATLLGRVGIIAHPARRGTIALEAMSEPDPFELIEDRAVFRPSGQVSLDEAIQLVTSAITFARERHIRKLLVVTSGLKGFEPPSITDRYFFVQEWALAAKGAVRVAVVARPEMIDSRKFGVTVAVNRGLVGDVFASEEEALAWLQSTI